MCNDTIVTISTTELATITGGEACRWINKYSRNPDPHQWAVRGRREQQIGNGVGTVIRSTRAGCRAFMQDL
jgi:hypothetical protein